MPLPWLHRESAIPRLPRLVELVFGAWMLCQFGLVLTGFADEIGITALRAELGASLPTGAGVGISQIEANMAAGASYLPDVTASEFTGKTITAMSGASAVSGHATAVAAIFYGNFSSIAPGVSAVDVYEANLWIGSGFLRVNSFGAPKTETRSVQNHSWIGSLGTTTLDTDALRRFDFAIQQNDLLACVGLNNGAGNVIPSLMGSAYNAISVGITNGNHSSGTTIIDGEGRVKPEIVAPQPATSFATSMVSSAGAMLRQNAPAAGRHSVSLKAMLLAGATKDQFVSWNRTTARPLDAHFGAGQLNILHSYHILAAGQQAASGTALVADRGWDYNTTAAASAQYFFQIPAGETASRFSTVLTWNRIIADTIAGSNWGNPSSNVPDLTLRLYAASGFVKGALISESMSSVDNVEHLFEPTLAPGRYVMEVTGNQTGIAYGLAWNAVESVSITATAPSANERGLAPGTFTFTRSGNLANALTVPFTVSGNATAGADYASLPSSVTIPAGATSATLAVTPLADSFAEGDETVVVTMESGVASTYATANATVTIHDQPIDAWRFSHFTAAELGNPAVSGDLADSDGDGIVNLLEYALNLDPKTADVNALPAVIVNPGGYPTLTYTASTAAVDISYIVEISTDLVTWNAGPYFAALSPVADNVTPRIVTVSSAKTLATQPIQFMRLRVIRQ